MQRDSITVVGCGLVFGWGLCDCVIPPESCSEMARGAGAQAIRWRGGDVAGEIAILQGLPGCPQARLAGPDSPQHLR